MPLSEHEQRLLEQMERALYAEDPGLATTLRGGGGRIGARGALVGGILGALTGIGVILGGVASNLPLLSVLGFLILLGGAWFVVRAVTAPAVTTATPTAGTGSSPRARGLMARAEERFQRRREQQGE